MRNIAETLVTFHRGDIDGFGRMLAVLPFGSTGPARWAVVTDRTPFHPVDHSWPDQPADHGVISLGRITVPVVDTQLMSVELATGRYRIGSDVLARRGDPDHVFAVAHLVDADGVKLGEWLGQVVSLEVDVARRLALSAAHTGCHLVAFAFNEAVEELWTKEAPRDSRGHHNFDAAALLSTRHHVGGSVDQYRLGKSLRKRGFDHPRLIGELDRYVARTNAILASWLDSKAEVTITGESDRLTGQRLWQCAVSPPAVMPCGGTHVPHLGKIAHIELTAAMEQAAQRLTLTASTLPR